MRQVLITTAPYLLFVLALAGALAAASRLLRNRPTLRRALGFVLLVGYVWGNATKTVLGRRHKPGLVPNFDLFWSYRRSLSLSRHGLRITNASLFAEIILNYVLYVPLGCLMPFIWPSRYLDCGPWRGLARVMITACLCSVATECAQQLLRVGFFELDDVFGNTMGAALGYLLYRACLRFVTTRSQAASPKHVPRHMARS